MLQMSNDEYHRHPSISKSQLDMFSRDENALEWVKNCPVDTEKLKTLDFGTAMHAICLEPELLKTDFIIMPPFNGRSNAGKEEKAAWLELNKDKKVLTTDEYTKLNLMFESVMAHPGARRLIEMQGAAEESFFWTDEETGVECRCRPDKNLTDTQYLMDVKTTEELRKFCYSVEDYRYEVQDAYYTDGLRANDQDKEGMIFLVIQKKIELGRYPVAVWTLPKEAKDHGRIQYKQDLQDYVEYKKRQQLRVVSELSMHRNYMKKIRG